MSRCQPLPLNAGKPVHGAARVPVSGSVRLGVSAKQEAPCSYRKRRPFPSSALPCCLSQEKLMDFRIIGLNFLYALLGLVLMYFSFVGFDHMMKKINFEEELQKGNIAVAIFTGSIFIAIAIIVGGALN
jgi:hypothetical protein